MKTFLITIIILALLSSMQGCKPKTFSEVKTIDTAEVDTLTFDTLHSQIPYHHANDTID